MLTVFLMFFVLAFCLSLIQHLVQYYLMTLVPSLKQKKLVPCSPRFDRFTAQVRRFGGLGDLHPVYLYGWGAQHPTEPCCVSPTAMLVGSHQQVDRCSAFFSPFFVDGPRV